MLETNSFAIRPSSRGFEIRNRATNELIGTASEQVGRFVAILRRLIGTTLVGGRIEVREKPDDSLVFTIERAGRLLGSPVETRDALGALVGYFAGTVSNGSLGIYDKHQHRFSTVAAEPAGGYRILAVDGAAELGWVSLMDVDGTRVGVLRVSPVLSDQPLAKMLLLGLALVLLKAGGRS